MKGFPPLLRKKWLLTMLTLALLPGCDVSLRDVGNMLPDLSSGSSAAYAEPAPPVSSVPRGPDPVAVFAASATPGTPGTVEGEPARLSRAYNAASGRECREVIIGFGGRERTAVACREADGSFVSSRPLLRGALR